MQNKTVKNSSAEIPTLSFEASNRIMSSDYNFAALLTCMENTDDQSTVVNLHNYTSYNVTYKISNFELKIEQEDVVIGIYFRKLSFVLDFICLNQIFLNLPV